jgi:cell cycle checkpoint control protein RAD9A
VLKQPLQTAVSIDTQDFEEFDAIDNLHIAISVSDFKNMVIHAASLNADVSAAYSIPARPLQFSYSVPGIHCEFTLTTIGGERGGAAAAPAPNPAAARNLGRQVNHDSRASSVAMGMPLFGASDRLSKQCHLQVFLHQD